MEDFHHLTDTVSAMTEGKNMHFPWGKKVGLMEQKMEEGGETLV